MGKVKVIIDNRQREVKIPTGIRLLIRRCCNAVLQLEHFEGDAEVSVSFVDEEEIRKLNSKHREVDSVTDVLSFPSYTIGVRVRSFSPSSAISLSATPSSSRGVSPGQFLTSISMRTRRPFFHSAETRFPL